MQTGFSLLFAVPGCVAWRVILYIFAFLLQIIVINVKSKLSFSVLPLQLVKYFATSQ